MVRKLALLFPETSESTHFDKLSFKVRKKIFMTLDLKNNLACIRLSPIDQDVFSAFDKRIIYAVANKWGLHGWTIVDLSMVREDLFTDMLSCGYSTVASGKITDQ